LGRKALGDYQVVRHSRWWRAEHLSIKLAVLVFAIDDDPEDEPKRIEDLLAGRSRDARYDLLHGMQLILRAAEAKR